MADKHFHRYMDQYRFTLCVHFNVFHGLPMHFFSPVSGSGELAQIFVAKDTSSASGAKCFTAELCQLSICFFSHTILFQSKC